MRRRLLEYFFQSAGTYCEQCVRKCTSWKFILPDFLFRVSPRVLIPFTVRKNSLLNLRYLLFP